MTSHELFVLSAKDLGLLYIICKECGTRIGVDIKARLVEGCPSCHRRFPTDSKQVQIEFGKLHQVLGAAEEQFEFHLLKLKLD